MYFFWIDGLRGDRSHEEIPAEQKVAVVDVELACLRIIEPDRAHQRDTGAGHFFRTGVDIRQELVTQLDVTAADGFVFRAAGPRLVVGGAFSRMVAIDGVENAELVPARQQIGWRRT